MNMKILSSYHEKIERNHVNMKILRSYHEKIERNYVFMHFGFYFTHQKKDYSNE